MKIRKLLKKLFKRHKTKYDKDIELAGQSHIDFYILISILLLFKAMQYIDCKTFIHLADTLKNIDYALNFLLIMMLIMWILNMRKIFKLAKLREVELKSKNYKKQYKL